MGKLINRIPGSRHCIENMICDLEAKPGKLDIKGREPSILSM